MKRLLLLVLALTIASTALAQVSRPITQINDVTDLDPYAETMEFWQGDTVQYDVYARNGAAAMALTGEVFAIWMVSARTNYGTVYLASTGTVISATNGHVRINATRAQTILPATNYWSQVRLFKIVATTTQELSVAAWNLLTVRESIDVSASDYVTPGTSAWTFVVNITNIYGDVIGGAITNMLSSDGSISWSASGGPQPDASVAAYVAGVVSRYATGTPVYAESDPIWTAVSNAYAAATATALATGQAAHVLAAAVAGYTNRAAGALQSNVWALADSTTNYADRLAWGEIGAYYGGAKRIDIEDYQLLGRWGVSDSLTISTNLVVSGVITGNYFVGDGSGLTNLPAGGSGATQLLINVSGGTVATSTIDGAVLTITDMDSPAGADLSGLSNDVLAAWATASNAFTIAEAGSNLAARVAADFDGASNAFLKAETYTGTITGGTITTGAVDSVTTNGGILEITYVRGSGSGGTDTNTVIALIADPWAMPTALNNSPTVTLTRANGNLMSLVMTQNVSLLTLATNELTDAAYRATLYVSKGAFSLAFDTAAFSGTTLLDISTNNVTILRLNKPPTEPLTRVRQ